MTVAHLYRVVQDAAGNVVPGAQVSLCDPGSTDALITDTVYADPQLTAVMTNPFTTPDGVINIYLARPRTVTLKTLVAASTQYIGYVDVLPAAENLLAATSPIVIGNDAFVGGILQVSDSVTAQWVDPVSTASTIGLVELLVDRTAPHTFVPVLGNLENANVITAEVDCLVTGMRFWVASRTQDGNTFTATVYDQETQEVLGRVARIQVPTDPVDTQVVVQMIPFILPAGRTVVASYHQTPGYSTPGSEGGGSFPGDGINFPPPGPVVPPTPELDGTSFFPNFPAPNAIDGNVTSIAEGQSYGTTDDPAFPTELSDAGAGTDLVVAAYVIGSPVGPPGPEGASGPQGPTGVQGPPAQLLDVQDFTANGVWTKPANAKVVTIICIAPGGGGGGGAKVASGTACSGGASGAGGGMSVVKIDAADLPATVNLSVFAGGAGGAGATTAGPGTAGSVGTGNSIFGSYVFARPGGGGTGGAIAAASVGGGFGPGLFPGLGGVAGPNGAAGNAASLSAFAAACVSGGSGGGISAAGAHFAGGSGGSSMIGSSSAGAAGTAGGGTGGSGVLGKKGVPGTSPGGGGSNTAGDGGNGGLATGCWGAGGGGGGSSIGGNGGRGSDGGAGFIRVITELSSGVISRSTTTATTLTLAPTASSTVIPIVLGKAFTLYSIMTSRAARVRLYTTAAAQAADLSRPIGTSPSATSGVILDFVTTAAQVGQTLPISPMASGSNLESTPTASIPMTVTNTDTTTGAITVTMTSLRLE